MKRRIWNKPFKQFEQSGSIGINNRWIGDYNEHTNAIVVESVTRQGMTVQKPMRTSNVSLLAGENTIAVFRIKERKGLSGTDSQR
jgi:hypothetical protein